MAAHVPQHQVGISKHADVQESRRLEVKEPPRLAPCQQASQGLEGVDKVGAEGVGIDDDGRGPGAEDLVGGGAAELAAGGELDPGGAGGRGDVEVVEEGRAGRVEVEGVQPGVADGQVDEGLVDVKEVGGGGRGRLGAAVLARVRLEVA